MQYILLIYGPDPGQSPSADGQAQMSAEYADLTASLHADGSFLAGEALHPVATATTVRVRDGKATFTDGPYVEGAEVANGYYVLSASDRDEAVKIASMIPATSVELRQLAGISGL